MSDLTITRTVRLPDRLRLARFARAPELGPKVLFFSGGSALNPLSRHLIAYTHNSVHLITPFDSGGSSAKLRQAFAMPAVGDLRNRMMALADQSVTGNPAIYDLFAHRLSPEPEPPGLEARLDGLISGRDPLIQAVPDPMRKIIRTHLGFFRRAMPAEFNLKGASLGNLVLAGGYLNNDRHLDPVVFLFSKLAEVRGVVRPIVNKNLELAVDLEGGETVVGQHLITGREVPPLDRPIKAIRLVRSAKDPAPVLPSIRDKTRRLIRSAELICYPLGSFFSSLLVNLLPRGVGRAVASADCPKVYIPNTGRDKEWVAGSVADQVGHLIRHLDADRNNGGGPKGLLDFVLVDSERGDYRAALDLEKIRKLGVRVIDTRLVREDGRDGLDPELILGALLSLV